MTTTATSPQRSGRRHALRVGAIALTLLSASACSTMSTTTAQNQDGGIGYRQARFEEISAMREFRACRDQALELDRKARESGNAGRFLASARLLESCESELGPEAAGLNEAERMRAYALSIQNYIKGGDTAAAAQNLETFRRTFEGKDLYLANGASFTETMAALLGQKPDPALGRLSTLNVASGVKDELRRARYWRSN